MHVHAHVLLRRFYCAVIAFCYASMHAMPLYRSAMMRACARVAAGAVPEAALQQDGPGFPVEEDASLHLLDNLRTRKRSPLAMPGIVQA